MTETNALTASLLAEIPKHFPNIRVWRQNTGAGVPMSTVKAAIALIVSGKIASGVAMLRRPTRFGIVGGGDLSGIIGPLGRRLECEIKVGRDKQSPEQIAFGVMIEERGGLYLVVRDVPGCLEDLKRYV